MKNLPMSVLDVNSGFSWKWYLKDLPLPDKSIKVFSTFSCGGGSTMGYKRAGFEVIGNVEIDKKINAMYIKNHHPMYNFNMDLRDFNNIENLPEELFNLDILDGSPPCSTFSTTGKREATWNVEKQFREGQKKQRLDDLFFVFLDTVKKLRPRIVIAENVTGLLKGNAKGYVNEIIKKFHELNYQLQIFKLNACHMEVPQIRERIFFIANNQNFLKLKLDFTYPVIPFGKVRSQHGIFVNPNSKYKKFLEQARQTDKNIGDIKERLGLKENGFSHAIVADTDICYTLIASGNFFRLYDRQYFSDEDYINVQTFPQDYDFCDNQAHYICGMSVPPNMMAHIAMEIYKQWL